MKQPCLCFVKQFFTVLLMTFSFAPVWAINSNPGGPFNWSSPQAWQGGVVPSTFDQVTIVSGSTVIWDSDVVVAGIMVDGTLNADMEKDLKMSTPYVMVHGNFSIGTPENRYSRKAVITLTGSNPQADLMGMGTKMIGAMGSGVLNFHGQQKYSWTMINTTAEIGATSITVDVATGWSIGDQIVITTTSTENDLDKKLAYTETERRTITQLSPDGRTFYFEQPLRYRHYGEMQSYSNGSQSWEIDERAEVGLLTRNIVIQGDESSESNQFGGHVMVMAGAKAYVNSVEFYRMGQAGLMARYPFHWHMTGDVTGQYIANSAIHHSYQRAVTVHGVQNARVEDNVCYDIRGHAIFLEDGNETNTYIRRNLISYVHKPDADKVIRPSDVFNLPSRIDGPAGIWVSHPTNDLIDNAVSSCGSGIWYALLEHPDGPSYDPNVWVNNQPLGNVDNNRTHGCYSGFIVDFADVADRARTEAVHYNCPPGQVVKNATSFDCMRTLWWRGNYATFENFRTANSYTHQGANVFTFYGRFKDGLMLGHSDKSKDNPDFMTYGTAMYDGNHEMVNVHFENFDRHNQALTTMIGGASKNLPMTMENCTYKNSKIMHVSPYFGGEAGEFNVYSSFILDKTGQVLGAPNKWASLRHPYIIDDSFTELPGHEDIGTFTTDVQFARVRLTYNYPSENNKSTLYSEWADGHATHNRPLGGHWEMPVAVNTDRLYKFRWQEYIPSRFTLSFGEARAGDRIRFYIEGLPAELNVQSNPDWPYNNGTPIRRVYSKGEFDSASDNVYYYEGDKVYVHLIARYTNDERTENLLFTTPGGNNLNSNYVVSRPFNGVRHLPGDIVQAEHFDHGGNGSAYNENRNFDYVTNREFRNNDHIAIRHGEMVDLTRMSVSSSNYYISDTEVGEWWNYSSYFPDATIYDFKLGIRSVGGQATVRLWSDSDVLGEVVIPLGSDFSAMQLSDKYIGSGNHTISVELVSGKVELDWISFDRDAAANLPQISLLNPIEGNALSGSHTLSVQAYDPDLGTANGAGIQSVILTIERNGQQMDQKSFSSPAFDWMLNTLMLENGLYELRVQATSTQNNEFSEKSFALTIENKYDCEGVLNGPAFVDACGSCVNGTSGLEICSKTLWETGAELSGLIGPKADFEYTIDEEMTYLTANGGNAHFWGGGNLWIPTAVYPYFHVRMKNSGSKTSARISWGRMEEEGLPGKSYEIESNSNEFVDYVLYLGDDADYRGTINTLLFQLTNGSDVGQTIVVDRIEFSRTDQRDCDGVWRGQAETDRCNVCVGGNTGLVSAPGCSLDIQPNYWDFEGDTEGWSLTNHVNGEVVNGVLELDLTGSDPYVHSPWGLAHVAEDYQYIVIRAKNETNSSTGEIFWVTEQDDTWNSDKHHSFTMVPNDDQFRYYIVNIGSEQNWQDHVMQFRIDPAVGTDVGNVQIDFIKMVSPSSEGVLEIPGIVQAQSYSVGGQGNTYFDIDPLNHGGTYNLDEGVDVEFTGDSNGQYNVGWIAPGEWVEYLVYIEMAGSYSAKIRAASPFDGKQIQLLIDGETVGPVIDVSNTGGYQTYQDYAQQIELPAGLHVLRWQAVTDGFNLNYISFEKYYPQLTAYLKVDNQPWVTNNLAEVCQGGSIQLGPQPLSETGWSWEGPGGFTASTRSVSITPFELADAGVYTAFYTDDKGNSNSLSFEIGMIDTSLIDLSYSLNGVQHQYVDAVFATDQQQLILTMTAEENGSFQWFGPDGAQSAESNILKESLSDPDFGIYQGVFTNSSGCSSRYSLNVLRSQITDLVGETIVQNTAVLYPNPASRTDQIEYMLSDISFSEEKIRVYDMYGRMVHITTSIQEGRVSFSADDLTSGLYTVVTADRRSILVIR